MNGLAPYWIDPFDETNTFPDVSLSLDEPDGLLAIGGSLSPSRLEVAYRRGIFPWYNEEQPILWWSPNPRSVLFPEQLKISKSLNKTLKQDRFEVTIDRAFPEVIEACRQSRATEPGTWITTDMRDAYCTLHQLGHAHSVECWSNGELVGGLYGVAFGRVFFGESMFSQHRDTSKVAFSLFARQLLAWGYKLIDCQVHSPHLASLGAIEIPRSDFVQYLDRWCSIPGHPIPWAFNHPKLIG